MQGKVVLVTGANGGLGTYVTQAFLDAGATVIGTSRKMQQSDFSSPSFTAVPAEISSREGAQVLADRVVAHSCSKSGAMRTFRSICVSQSSAWESST
jgi:NAD(P)-dependent dehydrogenase (short-subunit alcohol dehydrogenase family)